MQKQKFYSTLFFIVSLSFATYAQFVEVSLDKDQWKIDAKEHRIETYKGHQALYLDQGKAILPDVKFQNGIIEFDIAIPENRQFSGIVFRWQDARNFEEFYVRPHQSGNPDAMQYTPVTNGLSAWQLYYGEGYSTPYTYKFDEWMHIKLVLSDGEGEIYIEDMEKPLLHFHDLKRAVEAGALGLTSSRGGMHVANLKYQKKEKIALKSPSKEKEALGPGMITSWQVSDAFGEKELDNQLKLEEAMKKQRSWTKLSSDFDGMTNLGNVNGRTQEKNTAFARFTLVADKEQIKRIDFGFSDIVHVYCNGQLVFRGSDIYASRDYRFLGTMGLFDSVYLPLKKGSNEVWFAVTERFGGWGVKAEIKDLDGVKIK